MKFSWIFGSSIEARHLLYSYITVWLIQGGYALWIVTQWIKAKKVARVEPTDPPGGSENF